MAQNVPVTAAADDEEEFEEFAGEQWPVSGKEDTSLWDAEVRGALSLALLCPGHWCLFRLCTPCSAYLIVIFSSGRSVLFEGCLHVGMC
jgi:hypothetical protein